MCNRGRDRKRESFMERADKNMESITKTNIKMITKLKLNKKKMKRSTNPKIKSGL